MVGSSPRLDFDAFFLETFRLGEAMKTLCCLHHYNVTSYLEYITGLARYAESLVDRPTGQDLHVL